jgi:hypothetical protein
MLTRGDGKLVTTQQFRGEIDIKLPGAIGSLAVRRPFARRAAEPFQFALTFPVRGWLTVDFQQLDRVFTIPDGHAQQQFLALGEPALRVEFLGAVGAIEDVGTPGLVARAVRGVLHQLPDHFGRRGKIIGGCGRRCRGGSQG